MMMKITKYYEKITRLFFVRDFFDLNLGIGVWNAIQNSDHLDGLFELKKHYQKSSFFIWNIYILVKRDRILGICRYNLMIFRNKNFSQMIIGKKRF